MSDYTLAVGTHDPHVFSAASEADAVRYAVGYIEARHADEVRDRPEEAVTLMGADGLVTGPAERVDAFLRRVPGRHAGVDPDRLQPGDGGAPDCNAG